MNSVHVSSQGSKLPKVRAKIEWETFQDDASGQWIGVCDVLGLNASGETHSDLVKEVNEVMGLLIRDLVEEGDLDEFLTSHGWSLVNDDSPVSSSDLGQVELPWELKLKEDEGAACAC